MARFNGTTNPGRPYRPRSEAYNVIPANVNPGQWLTVGGRQARLGANNTVVLPNGRGRKNQTVSLDSFLMACGQSPTAVLTTTLPVRESASAPVAQTA